MNENALDSFAESLLPLLQQAAGRKGLHGGLKHDASGTPISSGYSHGPGGNFTFPGVDPDYFQTVVGNIGIFSQLASVPVTDQNPVFGIVTGVQDITGSEKTENCGNAPTAGLIKNCLTTVPFGRYERATPELELNRLGQTNNRADPMDLRMVGSPINAGGPYAQGPRAPATPADLLLNEISRKFFELNMAFHRLLSVQLWQGDPANNNGDAYKEFPGFQQQVNTGYVDAETGTACPSVDSDLKDFNYGAIHEQGEALVDAISYLIRTRKNLASRTGMNPVRWVLAMREELFWEITSIWSCSYLVYRCNVTASDGDRVMVNAQDAVRFRDEMRAGNYLLLDGERIEVVLDDGIPEATATTNGNVTEGCFASDIYLIPMSVLGGRAVTYMQHFDYNNPSLAAALGDNLILGRAEGAFLTWPRQTNQCVVWQSKTEPRLVMRTPWLAGRLQNVMYCPTQHTRQPFPDDPYFVNGGLTERTGPSLFALWQD